MSKHIATGVTERLSLPKADTSHPSKSSVGTLFRRNSKLEESLKSVNPPLITVSPSLQSAVDISPSPAACPVTLYALPSIDCGSIGPCSPVSPVVLVALLVQ